MLNERKFIMELDKNELITESIKVIVNKYINDIAAMGNNEIYAVFDIIQKQYKETNECPICNGDNRYRYCDLRIGTNGNHFFIINDCTTNLCIPVNYCPICGKKISN
jgi:hypothetical protein